MFSDQSSLPHVELCEQTVTDKSNGILQVVCSSLSGSKPFWFSVWFSEAPSVKLRSGRCIPHSRLIRIVLWAVRNTKYTSPVFPIR